MQPSSPFDETSSNIELGLLLLRLLQGLEPGELERITALAAASAQKQRVPASPSAQTTAEQSQQVVPDSTNSPSNPTAEQDQHIMPDLTQYRFNSKAERMPRAVPEPAEVQSSKLSLSHFSLQRTPRQTTAPDPEPPVSDLNRQNQLDRIAFVDPSTCKGCTCCVILRQRLEREKPIDKRLPVEVWSRIFQYLYPSQLSRVSLVSKTLYDVVDRLDLWLKVYLQGYLEVPVPNIDTNILKPDLPKRLMLYVFARSFSICEQCFRFCDGETPGRLPFMPLPVGERLLLTPNVDESHTRVSESKTKIHLCLNCRRAVYEAHPEVAPADVFGFSTKKELKEMYHLGDKSIQGITLRTGGNGEPVKYFQWEALKRARQLHGGDIGIEAVPKSLSKSMKIMNGRIFRYRLKYG
ncbi:hypothetical protein BGZ65_005893 [Modicella reniformis]|uniref:F-box domain-containing protein n=1 Tax=Modicella reniformis TaxID=1440133 RepID=A0A9P6IWT9_9FUNG|nr:hypothetical protein BGZ65_005893 [Modicella reniformis]